MNCRYAACLTALSNVTKPVQDRSELDALERKLSVRDIKLYRGMARTELRRERALARQEEREHPKPPPNRGWVGWFWGGKQQAQDNEGDEDLSEGVTLNEAQRKELYDAIDYDESKAAHVNDDMPSEALKLRVKTDLRKGSFALQRRHGKQASDLVSVVFDAFRATLQQRSEGMIASVALGGISVFDGTQPGTRHPQIVRVKEDKTALLEAAASEGVVGPKAVSADDPFFFAEFESQPLDKRADVALNVRMRFLEIIYHRGYVEAIVAFFKPPESQLESVTALIDVASETLEGIRKETRAGLEYALEKHRTVDLRVDMNAPIIVIPEDVTLARCQHIVLDAGHIAVESELVDKKRLEEIRKKQSRQYSEKDFQQLEDLMYDRFYVRLESTQVRSACSPVAQGADAWRSCSWARRSSRACKLSRATADRSSTCSRGSR
jgi:vacuolar protein sorting-associated protein 13A/C